MCVAHWQICWAFAGGGQKKSRVHLILMADGVTSRQPADDGDLNRRLAAMKAAQRILEIKNVIPLSLPDNKMDANP